MNLQSTDFELFQVPVRFAQDTAHLDAVWKQLQREVHPDRFAAQGAAAQRVALQWSARINEAYQRLKDPISRAAYLCKLHGEAIDAERNTAMPPSFLMQQLELREAIDEASDSDAITQVEQKSKQLQSELLQSLAQQIDAQADWAAAAQTVRVLMFLRRLAADVDRRRATLDKN